METKKLFRKDFTLMILGQIISIFGNNILRFALPLYLYTQTGSATLYGTVSAIAFLPMIILFPIGGIFADRVNKRNVMVILDAFTAVLGIGFMFFWGSVDLVVLMVVTLIILYGIQAAYQPAVQASVPVLVDSSQILAASAVVNQVNALGSLLGPVLGGMIMGFWGLKTILIISIICFAFSSVMEIFIHIPHKKQKTDQKIWDIVKGDFGESIRYITRDRKEFVPILIIVAAINLFYSTVFVVGLPVIINSQLGFSEALATQLYGYTQGAVGAGALVGGILTGILANRMKLKHSVAILMAAVLAILPCGIVLLLNSSGMVPYLIISVSSFAAMAIATMFSIQMMAYVQRTTPQTLLGKVMSVVMMISICAQPVGQVLYGWLFDRIPAAAVIIFAVIVSALVTVFSAKFFSGLSEKDETADAEELVGEV